ncbi:MAG: phosphate signaling complex protein PhoU [Bacteroidales bacterium]|nr:phosphate signaling complex protein PhoU [Bacteroidales bacterium]
MNLLFDEKLKKLIELAIQQSRIVEQSIGKCINGLLSNREDLLLEVINKDEPEMDKMENEIDELCTNILARFQPEAKELRIVLMIFKMNNDFERMSDMAANIAESALFLIKNPQLKPYIDIPRMANECLKMIRSCIDSFVACDSSLLYEVIKSDTFVDQLHEQIIRELITFMLNDPRTIERALHIERISKNFERIADLATNIAEDIIFIIDGKVVKHSKNA